MDAANTKPLSRQKCAFFGREMIGFALGSLYFLLFSGCKVGFCAGLRSKTARKQIAKSAVCQLRGACCRQRAGGAQPRGTRCLGSGRAHPGAWWRLHGR